MIVLNTSHPFISYRTDLIVNIFIKFIYYYIIIFNIEKKRKKKIQINYIIKSPVEIKDSGAIFFNKLQSL